MLKPIDDFLNNITMYRLTLYFLIILACLGFVYSIFGVLPFDPIFYAFSITFILIVSYVTNWVFAKVYEAPRNVESVWISALILGLIVAPPKNLHEGILVFWTAVLAMAGKYIFAIERKHLFNPVALSVFLTATFINGTANWWIGTPSMLPFVAVGGFLIIRKIRRWDLVLAFLVSALVVIGPSRMVRSLTESPLIFFATIMLSEPLTTPPTRLLRMVYGVITGFFFAPQVHILNLYMTPEIALIIGNIFSYVVSPKYKILLTLKEKIRLSPDTFDFIFTPPTQMKFKAGQYMEFTFEHPNSDSRGNRRYLSLANSPTESEVRLGIKFADRSSSFKKNLLLLRPGEKIVASQLIGDFTLPKNTNTKLAFIAGGIGITPFRSMIKYLIDANEKRDIVVLYTASQGDQFIYRETLEEAKAVLGAKIIYVNTSLDGHVSIDKLANEIPDYKERTFFLSGSHGVVSTFENLLRNLKVQRRRIITDYFPGFA